MKPQIIEDFSALEASAYKSQYFRKALEGTEYVLCLVSAAEYLGLCSWTTEPMIYVFSKEDCLREGIEIASKKGLWYTTVNQTINDLLSDPEVDEQVILESLADWFATCAEGVYGTRPYRVPGEGPTKVVIQGFTEEKTAWTPYDIRYTQKGNTVYAFLLGHRGGGAAALHSIAETARNVRLLGYGNVEFAQNFGVLTARLPETLPAQCANCLAIEVE